MSKQNFVNKGTIGGAGVIPETKTFKVNSGTTASVAIGDVVVCAAGYCAKVADNGMATAGKYGLARSVSTETSSVVGNLDVMFCPSGLMVEGGVNGSFVQTDIFSPFSLTVSSGVQTLQKGLAGEGTLYGIGSGATSVRFTLPWTV